MKSVSAFLFIFASLEAVAFASQTKNVDITTVIQNHFAETTLSSDVLNNGNTSQEIGFQVMLPKEAFITHFEMVIDQVTYKGEITEKSRAKKLYTAAKRRGKTTGLVEAREKAEKIFKTSVNVGAGTLVHFKLVYQQLLRKIRGKYTNRIILFGDQFSEHLTMSVYICEPRALKNVTVPPILVPGGQTVQPAASIDVDGNFGYIQFLNDNDDVMSSLAAGGGSFVVEYELESSPNGANVVINDGYFLYFGPDIQVVPRRMVFVLDVSGSMSGQKLRQVKEAMHNVLGKMTPLDRLDIIKFSSHFRNWKDHLAQATDANIISAKKFIDGSDELGGTNIWPALHHALKIMQDDYVDGNSGPTTNDYILLLTDGQGSLSKDMFTANLKEYNANKLTVNTIAFGNGANNELLKAVASETNGQWKQILVDLDSALQIENYIDDLGPGSNFSLEIGYPEVVAETLSVKSKYGGEIMNVGKFKDVIEPRNRGPHQISISGFSEGNEVVHSTFYVDQNTVECGGMGRHKIEKFAEKAFGMVKVEKALEEMELSEDASQKELLKEKAVNISILYKLVTSVTSLLVIKPEDEAEIEEKLKEIEEDVTSTPKPLSVKPSKSRKKQKTSSAGYRTSRPQWSLHSDPHFVARLSNDITVCFNWIGRNGEVVNLFSDERRSIYVNALIEGDSNELDKADITKRLFVTKLTILLPRRTIAIVVDPDLLTVLNLTSDGHTSDFAHLPLRYVEASSMQVADVEFNILDVKSRHVTLSISFSAEVEIVVEVHHASIGRSNSRDHLDFSMPDYYGDSGKLGGLFGHLQRKNFIQQGDTRIVEDARRGKTFLMYNHDKMLVKKSKMRIPYLKSDVDCWFVKSHFQHLLGSKLQHFKMKDLMEIPDIL